MANLKASKKDIIRSAKRRLRNSDVRSGAKTWVRKARTTIRSGDASAGQVVRAANRLLDKAAAKGIIHKRQAARRKSRLARQLARQVARQGSGPAQ